jgi:hypothetical protein
MLEPLNGQVVVRKGTTVSLECKANGNPAPTVTWVKLSSHEAEVMTKDGHTKKQVHHKRGRIASHDLANNGMIFTMNNVGRRDFGEYQCTATNGVGHDAVETINVQVLCKFLQSISCLLQSNLC